MRADGRAGRYLSDVQRLARHARLGGALTAGSVGLAAGLGIALLVALAAGSFPVARPLLLAGAAAAAGTLAGVAAGLARHVDRRALLFSADARIGSRELLGTAYEIAVGSSPPTAGTTAGPGVFAAAIIEDAAARLEGERTRRLLGALRLPALPWAAGLLVLCGAALLVPVDLKALFTRHTAVEQELASIGEDLRSLGQGLEEAARAENLGRRLALAQDLAQLGSDLAANRIQSDELLDRLDQMQGRIGLEYQLSMQAAAGDAAGLPRESGSGAGAGQQGSAPGGSGSNSGSDSGNGGGGSAGSPDGSQGVDQGSTGSDPSNPAQAGAPATGDAGALSRALDQLRQAQKALQGSTGKPGSVAQAPAASAGEEGDAGSGTQPDPSDGDGQSGSDIPSGSAPGLEPAATKSGAPTEIIRSAQDAPRRVEGTPGEGDSTSLLVRALPDWTGSKLPEGVLRSQYATAAESALRRDEIPPKLKASVRDYFTDIGMSGGQ
jgi:hypothetical protein